MNILSNPKRLIALMAVPLTLVVALPFVQAEDLPARGPIPFASYDTDANGRISEAEFNAVRTARQAAGGVDNRPRRGLVNAPAFADFDTDKDGKLTPAELAAGQQSQAQDRPGAGAGMGGSRGAGAGMAPPDFASVDTNGDGCINAAEFAAGAGNRSAGGGNGNMMPTFADFDADKDGYINETELNTGRAQRIGEQAVDGRQLKNVANAASFADIDTSKDGKIDPAEFAAHQASYRQPAQP